MQYLLSEESTGQTGYGFILSATGSFISHPVEERFASQHRIWDLIRGLAKASDLDRLARLVLTDSGEALSFEVRDGRTGQSGWIAFQPIRATRWTLGVVSIAAPSGVNVEERRRRLIEASLSLLTALLILVLAVARVGRRTRLWWFVFAASVLAILEIAFIWRLASAAEIRSGKDRVLIVDRAALNQYLDREATRELERLPTGLEISSIQFLSPDSIRFTGYVWQTLSLEDPEGEVEPAFHLPQGLDGPEIHEVWRREVEGRAGSESLTEVGWWVSARLGQNLEYQRYPLDTKELTVRFRHTEFERQVMLVPDVDAYPFLNPAQRPGVDSDLTLPGWRIRSSFFSLAVPPDPADGVESDSAVGLHAESSLATSPERSSVPELQMSVVAERALLGPFISNLLPVIVILCILFSLLMLVTRDEEKSLFGFSLNKMVGTSAGLFFAVLLAQIRMREALATSGLVYVEYFHFVLYLVLVLNLINAFLFLTNVPIRFIADRDNLWPKLSFWPLVLGLFLCITVVFFY
jgi:hypothetical protein